MSELDRQGVEEPEEQQPHEASEVEHVADAAAEALDVQAAESRKAKLGKGLGPTGGLHAPYWQWLALAALVMQRGPSKKAGHCTAFAQVQAGGGW
jgi:hypothetical protein